MKLIYKYAIVALVIFYSCASQEHIIRINSKETDLPLKIALGHIGQDSTQIAIFIPQVINLKNNYPYKIRHSKTYISVNGANISDGTKNPLFYFSDSLVRLKGETYESNQEREHQFYAGYTLKINNKERDSLILAGNFAQKKLGMDIYDIGNISESKSYLKRKIPDSLIGYLHFDFFNFEKKIGFDKNVSIKF